MKNIVLAMTGASGAIYGLRLGREILDSGARLTLLISAAGFRVIREETGLELKDGGDAARALGSYFSPKPGMLSYYEEDDFFAPIASGSSAPTPWWSPLAPWGPSPGSPAGVRAPSLRGAPT
jgi:4-hydroxy-3-polyprenylbenzoate decarboxylase